MLCDICKKNEATVHLTEVINDDIRELHICQACANAKSASMQQHFGIADLLAGLVDLPIGKADRKSHIGIKCQYCGMSYDNFKKTGRFGCAGCYDAFKRALYPLFKKIHGVSCYTEKKPKRYAAVKANQQKKQDKPDAQTDILKDLKVRLLDAIRLEEFETAAMLRDRIKAIEKSLTHDNDMGEKEKDRGKSRGKGRGRGKDRNGD
jgi:protein arginine kinase activator